MSMYTIESPTRIKITNPQFIRVETYHGKKPPVAEGMTTIDSHGGIIGLQIPDPNGIIHPDEGQHTEYHNWMGVPTINGGNYKIKPGGEVWLNFERGSLYELVGRNGATDQLETLTVDLRDFTPPIPINFKVVVKNNESVDLAWSDGGDLVDVYHILAEKLVGSKYERLGLIRVPAPDTTYTHCPGAGQFRYSVRAANNMDGVINKSEFTPPVVVVIQGDLPIPNAPSDLKVEPTGTNGAEVKVSWKDNSTQESCFHLVVERMMGTVWTRVGIERVPENVTSVLYRNMPGYYRFAVRSAYTIGEVTKKSDLTPWVEVVAGQDFPDPLPPTNLKAVVLTDGMVELSWEDKSDNETAFHIICDKWDVAQKVWVRQPVIQIRRPDVESLSAFFGYGRLRFAVRSAYSYGPIIRKSALTPWVEVAVNAFNSIMVL